MAAVAEAHGALVVVDEIHAPLTFGATFTPWQHVQAGGTVLTSASKAFNLPGLKLGFVVGEAASALDEDLRYHAGYAGVVAAEAAFTDGDEWLDETIATIAANQRALPELLPEGVRLAYAPEASYLAWLECDFDDPFERFLERGRVALQPGPSFGAAYSRYVRLNVGHAARPRARGRQADGAGAGLSSTTSTTWRLARARYAWCSGARAPSSQVTSASVSARKSSPWALRKSVKRERKPSCGSWSVASIS